MTTFFKAMAVVAAVSTGTAAMAADTEHKFELAADYYGECAGAESADFDDIRDQVKAFTDMEIMAATLNDPHKFFELLSVVNDPHSIHVMASCASEPVMWDTWMQNAFSLEKWGAASVAMMNPEGMVKWMMAPIDPQVWTSVLSHGDPDRYVKWGVAAVNPDFYSPVTNMLEVDWWGKRATWLTTAESYAPMLEFAGISDLF